MPGVREVLHVADNALGNNKDAAVKGLRVEKMSCTGAKRLSHSRRGESVEIREREAEGGPLPRAEEPIYETPVNHDQNISRAV
jgi:hypothetical protein